MASVSQLLVHAALLRVTGLTVTDPEQSAAAACSLAHQLEAFVRSDSGVLLPPACSLAAWQQVTTHTWAVPATPTTLTRQQAAAAQARPLQLRQACALLRWAQTVVVPSGSQPPCVG